MLSFDGADDHVNCGNDASLDLADFTFEALVKPNDISNYPYIISKGDWGIADGGYHFQIYADGKVVVGTAQPGAYQYTASGAGVVVAGEWVHLTATKSDDRVRIYKNGEEVSYSRIDTHTDPQGYDRDLYIARSGGTYFNSLFALACIYSRVLTEDEIKWNYMHPEDPVREGLVLWLKMNEGYGDTVYDLSGYGNHGTIHGASWVWDTVPSGLSPLLTEYPSLNTYSLRISGTEVITKDRDIYANKIYGTVGSRELLSNPLRGLKDLKNVEFREDGIPIEKTLPEGVKIPESEETVNLSHTIGWLTLCVKELSDKVELLDQRIKQLEGGGGS